MCSIKIANKREEHGTEAEGCFYVGRPTPLGNPFSHAPSKYVDEDHHVSSRALAVRSYRDNWESLIRQPGAIAQFAKIVQAYRNRGAVTLVCWCHPRECHAEVIRDKILEAVRNA